ALFAAVDITTIRMGNAPSRARMRCSLRSWLSFDSGASLDSRSSYRSTPRDGCLKFALEQVSTIAPSAAIAERLETRLLGLARNLSNASIRLRFIRSGSCGG